MLDVLSTILGIPRVVVRAGSAMIGSDANETALNTTGFNSHLHLEVLNGSFIRR